MEIKHFGIYTLLVDRESKSVELRQRRHAGQVEGYEAQKLRFWIDSQLADLRAQGYTVEDNSEGVGRATGGGFNGGG